MQVYDLSNDPIVNEVILEFEIKGRLDYKIEQGKTTAEGIKVTAIPDSNDVMITYPDGAEQRLFGLAE